MVAGAGALKATTPHNNSGREGGPANYGARRTQDVQCARTSPCAHARHMARRLALLTLLACAAAVRRPPKQSSDISDSQSLDPFSVWDEYSDSYENTPPPRLRTTTLSAKVILKGKIPKVNVTMKNAKGEEKKVIKTTNINIESHTNFIVTKPPLVKPNSVTGRPVLQIGDQYVLLESPDMDPVTRATTRRPSTTRRTTRRPSTTRRLPSTTRRPTTRPMRRTPKTTKSPYNKKTTCPPKYSGWLSSFFEDNKLVRVPVKPAKSGWFVGRSV